VSQFLRVYTDGGARGNPGPGASAFVILKNGKVISKGTRFFSKITNNVAEYQGVVMALSWLSNNKQEVEGGVVAVYTDSQLVARQLGGLYKIKSAHLKPLAETVAELTKKLSVSVKYFSVPRGKNRLADALVNKEIDENI